MDVIPNQTPGFTYQVYKITVLVVIITHIGILIPYSTAVLDADVGVRLVERHSGMRSKNR